MSLSGISLLPDVSTFFFARFKSCVRVDELALLVFWQHLWNDHFFRETSSGIAQNFCSLQVQFASKQEKHFGRMSSFFKPSTLNYLYVEWIKLYRNGLYRNNFVSKRPVVVMMIVTTKRRRVFKSECYNSKGFLPFSSSSSSLLKLRNYLLLLLLMMF